LVKRKGCTRVGFLGSPFFLGGKRQVDRFPTNYQP
jgi:hypothetical protein